MGPEVSIIWRVWVQWSISVSVVIPVIRHPLNWIALYTSTATGTLDQAQSVCVDAASYNVCLGVMVHELDMRLFTGLFGAGCR